VVPQGFSPVFKNFKLQVYQETRMNWIVVGIGGALGSMARHGVNMMLAQRMLRGEPYATATVNIAGSLAIGLLAGSIAGGRLQLSAEARTFLFVGILGGFTTFSSFVLDTFTLAEGGRSSAALVNVLGQVVVGYAVAYLGFRLAA
jgi:fluoride exporter